MPNQKTGVDFAEWLRLANANLTNRYAIDFRDAGLDEEELRRYAAGFPEREEFVSWFGERYDLVSRERWGWR
jgi:hypothetical protein